MRQMQRQQHSRWLSLLGFLRESLISSKLWKDTSDTSPSTSSTLAGGIKDARNHGFGHLDITRCWFLCSKSTSIQIFYIVSALCDDRVASLCLCTILFPVWASCSRVPVWDCGLSNTDLSSVRSCFPCLPPHPSAVSSFSFSSMSEIPAPFLAFLQFLSVRNLLCQCCFSLLSTSHFVTALHISPQQCFVS